MLFMGIDVGTQGVRCVVADAAGNVLAAKSVAFAKLNIATHEGWYEQSPSDWKNAAEESVRACTEMLGKAGISAERIRAISVDGTSGTIVPLDSEFEPLCNGIMYNDPRAKEEAAIVHAAMGAHEKKHGLKFGASFSLPRVMWVLRQRPEIYEKTRIFAHQADYVTGLLCGEFCVSDYSNALKTGYDLLSDRWPDEVTALGIDTARLPKSLLSVLTL